MILYQTPRLNPTIYCGHPSLCAAGSKPLSERLQFCTFRVREFFDFPEDAKNVRLVAHNRPGKDRVKVHLEDDTGGFRDTIIEGYEDVGFYYIAAMFVDKLLQKHGVLYVALTYEEVS